MTQTHVILVKTDGSTTGTDSNNVIYTGNFQRDRETLFNLYDGSNPPWNGPVYEIQRANTRITDSQRDTIISEMKSKWGI